MNKKRVVFMGTPIFAAKILEHLLTFPIELVGVVSQMDKKVGRKQILTPTPVKEVAMKHNLNLFQPVKIKEIETQLQDLNIDVIITCAYGQFLPSTILACAKEEALNIHASLLPKYRGGAPIHWAVINGEEETGVSLMRMIKAMDAGEVFAQCKVKIEEDDTTSLVHDKLIECAKACCDLHLMSILEGSLKAVEQDESLVTFGFNISSQDEHILFNQPCEKVHNHIRGLIGWPVGYARLNGTRFKFYGSKKTFITSNQKPGTIIQIDQDGLHVSTLSNNICITHIQVEGRKMYPVVDDIGYLQQFLHHGFE